MTIDPTIAGVALTEDPTIDPTAAEVALTIDPIIAGVASTIDPAIDPIEEGVASAEAEEVSAASPKQCLGGKPERGKTFYGREGHPPSHLVEPPQGKDTPLRGGELQGGDQRGGAGRPNGG